MPCPNHNSCSSCSGTSPCLRIASHLFAGRAGKRTAALVQLNPKLLSPRNLFRSPGIWNFDTGILKNFRLPWESKKLQFRAEFFNLFNHSNLYVNPGLNNFTGPGTLITANRGVLPDSREERRNIQLALRFAF